MIARLTRTNYLKDGILGKLVLNDSIFYTLEHSYEDPTGVYSPKVPKGQYTCVRGMHRLPGHQEAFETFEITGIPGHTGILYHIGNTNIDSSGCVLLGKGLVLEEPYPQVTSSKQGFSEFMALLSGINQFEVEIL